MLSLLKKKKKEKLPARQRGNSCLNCETVLDGNENFCPECGQRNNINQLNFKLVLDEFIGNLITYDSRVWNTAVPLILKPGKVAYNFISGKRKQYVNPFRTYLTVSLIFFLIYGLLGKISELRGDGENKFKTNIVNIKDTDTKNDSLSKAQKDSIAKATLIEVQKNVPINIDSTLKANNVNIDSLNTHTTDLDSIKQEVTSSNPFFKKINTFFEFVKENPEVEPKQALDSMDYANTFWNRFYYTRAQKSHEMWKDKGQSFNEELFSNLSLAIFLFLPIFALFLKFIYLRRKYTYMEHMVFVFYTQTVFFLLLLLFILVNSLMKNSEETLIITSMVGFALYLLLAMKNFYKQGWIKTIIKYLMANFAFVLIASFGLSILAFVSFIFY